MRDLVLGVLFLYGPLVALVNPAGGILFWTWVSIMSPHKLSWRFGDKPVAFALALAILIGVVFTKRRRFLVTKETVAFMLFVIWILAVAYPFSMHFEQSFVMWDKVWRVDLMIMIALAVLRTRQDVVRLVWVVAFSVGFFGFKGGIFTIVHGGSYRVWGPDGGWLEGNNEIALAIVMTIPLIRFLQLQVPSRLGKSFCTLWMVLCAAAALGSQSRGALLAIAAMAFVMWTRSEKNKFGMAVALLVVAGALVAFMPQSWSDRMHTTESYETDSSAMGRIAAWGMAFNLAKDHPFVGGGFDIYEPDIYARYAPNVNRPLVAHSIYFSVMGEQGFVGLALFLNLWWQVWRGAGRVRREQRANANTKWVSDLGATCQMSLAGYLVGGAFLSLAYFDMPYNIMLMVVLGRQWVRDKGWETEPRLTGRLAWVWEAMGIGSR